MNDILENSTIEDIVKMPKAKVCRLCNGEGAIVTFPASFDYSKYDMEDDAVQIRCPICTPIVEALIRIQFNERPRSSSIPGQSEAGQV